MKKKVFALALAAALTVGSTVPAYASATVTPKPTVAQQSAAKKSSPEKHNTITPRPTITQRPTTVPIRTSPKTGQTDYLLYGMLGAAAFGSVIVVSNKKRDEDA